MPTIEFHIKPGYESALTAAGLSSFDALMKADTGRALGWHAHREAAPVEIEVDGVKRRFFLKRVFRVPPKHAIWPLFRSGRAESQPRHEWMILDLLDRADIDAMRPVAMGERRVMGVPRQAFILVEAVPLSHTLEDWLIPGFRKPDELDGRSRHRLFHGLGALAGRLHARGFDWPDMVAKHIFASPGPGGLFRFCLIDVERMQSGRAVTHETAIRNLKQLRRSLRPAPISARELKLAGAGYRRERERGGPVESIENLGRAFFRRANAIDTPPRLPDDYEHPRQMHHRRLKRMIVAERSAGILERAGIRSLDDLFTLGGDERLNKPGLEGFRARIRFDAADDSGGRRVFYLKRYDTPPLREQLRRLCGGYRGHGTAFRELQAIRRLAEIGVPSMRWVAYGERMKGCWEIRSFLITEAIVGQSLEGFAEDIGREPGLAPSPPDRQEITRQLGRIVKLLHENRLFHRDLYLCHVMLTRNADGGIVLRLIDLARILFRPRRTRRWRIKDLAALDHSAPARVVGRADRLRFLYHYDPSLRDRAPARRQGRTRRLISAVRNRAEKMRRHDLARAARRRGAESPT